MLRIEDIDGSPLFPAKMNADVSLEVEVQPAANLISDMMRRVLAICPIGLDRGDGILKQTINISCPVGSLCVPRAVQNKR